MHNLNKVRVRFAPAPTGVMHIGNVRAALLNFLYARQKNGTFILRIEDTDAQRMFDQDAKEILFDLGWLGLSYDEGPIKGGNYGPYFQSQRENIYKAALEELIAKNAVYRCFCTPEELDKKRQRQLALKQPPRYDKACLHLNETAITANLNAQKPFVWRFNIPLNQEVILNDLAKGKMVFNTTNLTDFPLTRTDGSFTFLFANAVDDINMEMTHIFRGEDHLTNSASQILLYKAFCYPTPVFFHLPIICNLEGKKLSKRDFGFSIKDVQQGGYLPEAVCNYLAILGGSYENEIMSLVELIKQFNFDHLSSTSQIKYDPDKLNWINHKWIQLLSNHELAQRCLPFLIEAYPAAATLPLSQLESLIALVKTDIVTLKDAVAQLQWYFMPVALTTELINSIEQIAAYKDNLQQLLKTIDASDAPSYVTAIKQEATKLAIPTKMLMQFLRVALIGSLKGPNVGDIINTLGLQESKLRIQNALAKI